MALFDGDVSLREETLYPSAEGKQFTIVVRADRRFDAAAGRARAEVDAEKIGIDCTLSPGEARAYGEALIAAAKRAGELAAELDVKVDAMLAAAEKR